LLTAVPVSPVSPAVLEKEGNGRFAEETTGAHSAGGLDPKGRNDDDASLGILLQKKP
jgi:hypothetical protein